MKKSFNRRHAEEILNPCDVGRYITIDDRGVWPKVERDLNMQAETELLRWRPARVFQGEPDAPEVADTPMLSFPFSARDLAAFMLEGVGALMADFYGDWGDGPDPDSLRQIDPDSKARTAVIQAYGAYREVESIVGASPLAQQQDADRLRKKHREAKAAAKVKYGVGVEGYLNAVTNAVTPEAKAHNAEAEAHNARLDENIKKVAEAVADIAARLDAAIVQEQIATEAWLQAMVQQLLQPAPTTDTATPAPKADSEWVTKAQARAREIVKKSKELDRYPNQENLGDMVAAEFRKAGIVGADGKPLTGATIKRHALKGISSATGKQLSTTIAQGK